MLFWGVGGFLNESVGPPQTHLSKDCLNVNATFD